MNLSFCCASLFLFVTCGTAAVPVAAALHRRLPSSSERSAGSRREAKTIATRRARAASHVTGEARVVELWWRMAAAKSQRSARPSRASASADAVSIHVAGTRYSVGESRELARKSTLFLCFFSAVASAAAELGMSACSDESVSDW